MSDAPAPRRLAAVPPSTIGWSGGRRWAQRVFSSLAPAVRFYLATWDGTGDIERGLGQDAAIQKHHVGQGARSCLDADVYSGLLELHLDGPQAEEAVFTKSSDGVLLLTDFSRACAQQWLIQHGRRFCVQRVRKDKGKKIPERRKGTAKGVQMLARSAYETQCDMARYVQGLPVPRVTVIISTLCLISS